MMFFIYLFTIGTQKTKKKILKFFFLNQKKSRKKGGMITLSSEQAGPLGNSEGNCATPFSLYRSAMNFMRQHAPGARAVYFTGDFAEAGASYACTAGSTQVSDGFPKQKLSLNLEKQNVRKY